MTTNPEETNGRNIQTNKIETNFATLCDDAPLLHHRIVQTRNVRAISRQRRQARTRGTRGTGLPSFPASSPPLSAGTKRLPKCVLSSSGKQNAAFPNLGEEGSASRIASRVPASSVAFPERALIHDGRRGRDGDRERGECLPAVSIRGRAEVLGVRAGSRGPVRRVAGRQDPDLLVDSGKPRLYRELVFLLLVRGRIIEEEARRLGGRGSSSGCASKAPALRLHSYKKGR